MSQITHLGTRLDYFFNFNNSLQIANGLLPYKDINIITTPLFHFINSFFWFFVQKNIIVYASVLSIMEILQNNIDYIIDFENDMSNQNITTIILHKDAVIYHLAQNKYFKDYDLFMRGNFGENGEERILNDVKNLDNRVYLVDLYDYVLKNKIYNQIPNKIVDYVVEKYNDAGEIIYYTIYSVPK